MVITGSLQDPLTFSLAPDATVKLYLRDLTTFQPHVKHSFGAAAASLLPAMLPLSLTPKYFDVAQCGPGRAPTRLDFDFTLSNSTSSLRKNLGKLSVTTPINVQIEFSSSADGTSDAGTLVAFSAPLGNLLDATATGGFVTNGLSAGLVVSSAAQGMRFCDAAWKPIFMEFALLVVDIVAIVCFLALHFVPHRVCRMYAHACQSAARRQARKCHATFEGTRHFVASLRRLFDVFIDKCERARQPLPCPDGMRELRWSATLPWNQEAQRLQLRRDITQSRTFLDGWMARLRELGCPESFLDAHLLGNHSLCAVTALEDLGERYLTNLWHEDVTETVVRHDAEDGSMNGRVVVAPPVSAAPIAEDASVEMARAYSVAEAATPAAAVVSIDAFVIGSTSATSASTNQDAAAVDSAAERDRSVVIVSVVDLQTRFELILASDQRLLRYAADAFESSVLSDTHACGSKEGWGGIRSAIFEQVKELMIDIAAVVAVLVVTVTVYRLYPLIHSVWIQESYDHRRLMDRRVRCMVQLLEIGIDVIYLLKSVVVCATVRGLFVLPYDVVMLISRCRSFAAARAAVDYHFEFVLGHLLHVLSLVFAIESARFVLATLTFSLFSLGVVLESAFGTWRRTPGGNIDLDGGRNRYRGGLLLILALAWLIALPFVCSYALGAAARVPSGMVAVIFFSSVGALALAGILASVVRRADAGNHLVSTGKAPIRFLLFTLENLLPFFSVFVEGCFVSAIAVLLMLGSDGSSMVPRIVTASSSPHLVTVHRIASALLLQFSVVEGDLPVGAFAAVAIMCLHLVVYAMPVVVERMLQWRKGLASTSAWRTVASLTGPTAFVFVTFNVAALLRCRDSSSSLGASVTAQGPLCWASNDRASANHIAWATAAMVLGTYYLSSITLRSVAADAERGTQDVSYAPLFRMLTGFVTTVSVVIATLISTAASSSSIPSTAVAPLTTLIIGAAINATLTASYGKLFNGVERASCSSSPSLSFSRGIMYLFILASCVAELVALNIQDNPGQPSDVVAYALFGVGAACGMVLAVVLVYFHVAPPPRIDDDDIADAVRQRLLSTEASLATSNLLRPSRWIVTQRSGWVRRVQGANRASQLAVLTRDLMYHTQVTAESNVFWNAAVEIHKSLDDVVDEYDRDDVQNLEIDDERDTLDQIIFCCSCCRDVCDDGNVSQSKSLSSTEGERLRVVQRGVAAWSNSITVGPREPLL